MTKIHEEFIRGNIEDVINKIDEPKGEFVIIIEGSYIDKKEKEKQNLNELPLKEHYNFYEQQGMDKKEIIKQIAKDRGQTKNEIYQYFLDK